MLLLANEFLDALPIRQFVRRGPHWSERMVTLNDEDRFVFVAGPPSPIARLLIPDSLRDSTQQGALVEICPAALALAAALGARFSRQAGAALFIDYGYFPSAPGPTLRALHRHRPVSVLSSPGTSDLSAHVDFAAFAEAARAGGAETHGPVPQARLLAALGAAERATALRARAIPSQQRALDSGVERLLDPGGMGTQFKAIALISPRLSPPPGFDTGL
jgi:NADH dehydrogenase [ubiquinone] 1 alpha subcomplex assembly factor 7